MIKTTTDVIPETMAVMGKGSGVETKKSAKLMKAFIVLNIARFVGDEGESLMLARANVPRCTNKPTNKKPSRKRGLRFIFKFLDTILLRKIFRG